jgi:hypothetical protein
MRKQGMVMVLFFALIGCCVSASYGEVNFSVEGRNTASVAGNEMLVFRLGNLVAGDFAVKVYDSSGNCVRTLIEKYSTDTQLEVVWNLRDTYRRTVQKGNYQVKYVAGLRLVLDKSFGKDGVLTGFSSPKQLCLDSQGNIYVLDFKAGAIFKFKPDGSPANDFNGTNKFAAPSAPYWQAIAVDEEGKIYGAAGHEIYVYDGRGTKMYYIGGFFGDDPEWKTPNRGGFAYPSWIGLNADFHIYASSPGYTRMAAWDRRKPMKEGGLWMHAGAGCPGDAGDTDGNNIIYLATAYYTNKSGIAKFIDKGNTFEFVKTINTYYDKTQKNIGYMADINGVSFDGAGGIWVVERAPVKIIKIFDTGFRFLPVTSFGLPGNDAEKIEFITPRGITASRDGRYLFIVEDGDPISATNSTTGLARIVKYRIEYETEKQLSVTVR